MMFRQSARGAFAHAGRLILLMALALTLAVSPAGAQVGNTGSGTGAGEESNIVTGTDYANADQPFCLEVTASSYYVDVEGTFTADDGTNEAVYEGMARLHWETTEIYYIAPEGIYTELRDVDPNDPSQGQECDPATLGGSVNVEVTVTDSPLDPTNPTDPGSITGCQDTSGGYTRTQFSVITVAWSASCRVATNVTGTAVNTPVLDHLFRGTLQPGTITPGIVDGTWTYPAP